MNRRQEMKEDKETSEEVIEETTGQRTEENAENTAVAPDTDHDRNDWKQFREDLLTVLRILNPKNIFSGRMISIDFILHRWKTLLLIFFVLMFYISNRYSCQQKIAEIGELRKEVEEIGYKSLDMFSRLKNLQREEAVLKTVQDNGLNLSYPQKPPYVITYKRDGTE
ncbi:MAG: FtsL-like putative cell division protein [Bacteroidales bacterium]